MNLDAQLSQLEAAQILRRANDTDPTYIFKNALAQETAYSSLLNKTRRDIHLCIARALEELYADRADEYAALLAQHYDQAGDAPKTFTYSNRAGHAAMRVYACAEATAHFTRAITVAKELDAKTLKDCTDDNSLTDCYLHRGRALELTGKFPDALKNYEEMESLALARNDQPMQLAALVALATIHSTATSSSDSAHAQTLSNLALALARQIGDRRTEAKVLWNLMLLQVYIGDMPRAIEFGEQSLALSRELGMTEQTALTLNDLLRPYLTQDLVELGLSSAAEARKIFEQIDNQPMLSDNLIRSSIVHLIAAEFDQAMDLLTQADKINEAIGHAWGKSFGRMFVGNLYFLRGEISRAIETMRDSVRLGDIAGFFMPQFYANADLAMVHGLLGAVEQGIQIAEKSLRVAEERMLHTASRFHAILARLFLRLGDLDRAEFHLASGVKHFSQDFAQRAFNYLPLVELEIAWRKREHDRAIKTADEHLARYAQRGERIFVPEVLLLKGHAQQARGDAGAARESFMQARDEAEKSNARWQLWQIYSVLGERETARVVVEFIAQNTPVDLRARFLNLPAVREVLAR